MSKIILDGLRNWDFGVIPEKTVYYINKSRYDGILSLEFDLQNEEIDILADGLTKVVDGVDLDLINNLLEYSRTNVKKHIENVYDLVTVVSYSILNGDNPRILASKGSYFITGNDNVKSVNYFSDDPKSTVFIDGLRKISLAEILDRGLNYCECARRNGIFILKDVDEPLDLFSNSLDMIVDESRYNDVIPFLEDSREKVVRKIDVIYDLVQLSSKAIQLGYSVQMYKEEAEKNLGKTLYNDLFKDQDK